MNVLCFNDCLPPCTDRFEAARSFEMAFRAFAALRKDDPLEIDSAILTRTLPSELHLGEKGVLLSDVFEEIADRDLRGLAYGSFIKYPVHQHFPLSEAEAEALMECDYTLTVGTEAFDAFNLAIAARHGGYVFSMPVHADLKKDTLCIQSDTCEEQCLPNLYGDEENVGYIQSQIKARQFHTLGNVDKLKKIWGRDSCTANFERDFQRLSLLEQLSIIDHFQHAIDRNLATPFYPDTKLIKDVSPDAQKRVYELRVFTPTVLRVYFHEEGGTMYVAGVEKKSAPDQSADIKKAAMAIQRMKATR